MNLKKKIILFGILLSFIILPVFALAKTWSNVQVDEKDCGDFSSYGNCNKCNNFYEVSNGWSPVDYDWSVGSLVAGHRYKIKTTLNVSWAKVECKGGEHWYTDDCTGDECSVSDFEITFIPGIPPPYMSYGDLYFGLTIPTNLSTGGECETACSDIGYNYYDSNTVCGVAPDSFDVWAVAGFNITGFADEDNDFDEEYIRGIVQFNQIEATITPVECCVDGDCPAGYTCEDYVCVPGDQCTSGPCCDTSSHPYTYRPSSYVCDDKYDTDYGCPDGTSCGDDVKVRYKKRYCSGSSSSCSGSISSWGSWSTYDYCGSHEYCADNDPSCNSQCSSGVCCDGCRYRPSSYVCNEQYQTDYSCPWGTNCGDDVGVRYKTRSCPSDSSTCSGTISGWGSYTVYDDCLSTETCTDNDSTCNYTASCDVVCGGDLTVSISGSGTCTVTASLSASNCDGKPWQVKDDGTTKCSGTVSGSSYSHTCSSWTVGIGSYTYNLYIDGNWKDSDSVTCSAPDVFDFSISISPTSGSVSQNSSISATVSTALTSGSTQSVSFYILSGLPSGASASFDPTNCNPTCNSTMTINTSAATPVGGPYSTNICGTSGDKTHCVTYGLTVTEAGVEITPPSVTTNAATNITQTSATLNGTLNDMGNAGSCLVWFEWGTDPVNYGNVTPIQTMTAPGPFSADITGLNPDTPYYFEAKAKNGGSW